MKSSYAKLHLAMLAGCCSLYSQTAIDLRTQSKSVDFSAASFTKPSKTGTSLPFTCPVGSTFFKTDAAAGRNLFGCTSSNAWSLLGGNLSFGGGAASVGDCAQFDANGNIVSAGAACGTGSGGLGNAVTLATPFVNTRSLLVSSGPGRAGVESACQDLSGTLSCPGGFAGGTGTTSVSWFGNSGNASRQILGSSGPFTTSFNYRWSDVIPNTATLMKIGTPSAGESSLGPATPDTDYTTPFGAGTLQNKTLDNTNSFSGFTQWSQIPRPAAAAAGTLRIYAKSGSGLCWVNSLGVETCGGSGGAGGLPDPGSTGLVVETSPGVTVDRTLAAGSSNLSITNGDGVNGNPTIDIGPGVDFSGKTTLPVQAGTTAALPSTCSSGQLYFATDGVKGRQLRTCSPANTWTPIAYDQGTAAPATCTIGQIYFNTTATAGQNLYFCTATDTWTQMSGGGGGSGTVTVVSSGSLSNTALVTGGGSNSLQTPDAAATMDQSGNISTPGGLTTGSGSSQSGLVVLSGSASGGAGFAVPDAAAATPILYLLPVTAGTANQLLLDSGVVTCPLLPAGSPALCHQMMWGLVAASMLPAPGAVTLGGVSSIACSAGQHVAAIGTDGVPACTPDLAGGGGSVTAGDNLSTARGTGIVDYTPLDASVMALKDEFCGANSGSLLGELGWATYLGTASQGTPVLNHPCIQRITTGAAAGNQITLYLGQSGGESVWPDLTAFNSWEVQFILKLNQTANTAVRVGLTFPGQIGADPPTHGTWLKYDTQSNDTTWKAEAVVSGSSTSADTAVAVTSSNWFKIRIRSTTTGTLLYSVATDNGPFNTEKTACASSCNLGPLDTNAMLPFVQLLTRTSSAVIADVDWFAAKVRGLAR